MTENYITVSELNSAIKTALDGLLPRSIAVFGEVSGMKITGGNAYFTLKDSSSAVSCACFSCSKTYMPKDGESIVAVGSVDYWNKAGRLNFSVRTIEAVGKGALYIAFEKLKQKLEAEGLFDPAHKKKIKAINKRVLVVTSKTGAVIRDICTTVRRKNPVIDIVVKDVRVQGQDAARDIAQSLIKVDKLGYDVIILARGGGSLEDLAPFYDEWLVRVIYAMDTPIVSAIGHETDFSLCDFVADARAATPTAAAELVAYDYYAMKRDVLDTAKRLQTLVESKYSRAVGQTVRAGSDLCARLNANYSSNANKVNMLAFRATKALQDAVTTDMHAVEKLNVALDNLSPLKTLEQGYFKLLNAAGQPIDGVQSVRLGDEITAVGKDGRLTATVDGILENESEDPKNKK